MERFWTLKYLEQQGVTELVATLFKENMVRADSLPLVLGVLGAKDLPRGAKVRVRLGEIDEVSLDVTGTVMERLDLPTNDLDASSQHDDSEDDDQQPAAGPISIDMTVEPSPDGDNPQP
jgi:exoribonuclease-2